MNKNELNYLALDFGAESGRAIMVTLSGGKARLEEIHRFSNTPSRMNGTLYWDLPFLFKEIMASLMKASYRGIELQSLAVDTWGVDFGLLTEEGELLSNPVHYRDDRTKNIKEFSPISDEELFARCGGLPWDIGSVFQLYSMVKEDSSLLKSTSSFLNMPDLFNYLLCGKKRSEKTIASTSLIMGADGIWDQEIIDRFNLPSIFQEIVEPATVLTTLREDIGEKTGYKELQVIASCSHDTASVAAIVPDRSDSCAFLSSGTWSILGKIFDEPFRDKDVISEGFTNEASLDSWYLCKNITGLYPFQELKRYWDLSEDPWDYGKMCEEAGCADFKGLVDLEHDDFQCPGQIMVKIEKHLKENGYSPRITRGEAARILLESLALEYAANLKRLESLTSSEITTLYILGGGIKNSFLCQRTADMCRIKVIAGIDQGTALGNGLVQAYALGHIENPDDIRKIASSSFEMKTYFPGRDDLADENLNQYKAIKNKNKETYK